MKVSAFLKNKYVFHVLVFIGVINILGYIALENYNSMALFVVICLLSRYFSKNMSVMLIIAILVTSFSTLNNTIQEGFESKEGGPGDGVQSKLKKTLSQISKTVDKADEEKTKEKPEEKPKEKCTPENCPKGKCDDSGKCVPKSGFKNNVPSSKPAAVNNNEDEEIDVAATMEDAYSNLNKMLGDGAMKSMAKETKNLVSQQQNLMKTLHDMTPALGKAKETLANLNMPSMEEMTTLMKKFAK